MRKNICKRNIAIFMAATMVLSPVSSTFDNYSISNLVSVKAGDLEDFIVDGGTLVKYEGKGGDVVIPDGVTRIEEHAFLNCSELKSLTIPKSVTYIDATAFSGCNNLTSITLSEGISEVDPRFFSKCFALTAIYVSDNDPNYCSVDGVLYSKDKTRLIKCPGTKLGEFVVPEGVTEIGPITFTGCKYITSIRIPETVTQLNGLEFWSCTSLSRIYIPESVTTIKGSMGSNGENCIISEKQNVKIYSPSGSAAETYSKRYDNLTFVEGEMPANIPGDINGDSDVNSDDVDALRRYLAGDNVNVIKENLDVNGDGKVNSKDSTRLNQYVARYGVSIK
ncbi:MAG: leucine-rich repeat protein [Lachnospiraceae bacterium]|nr:leucine-rich repeat protein [Lachnospiraceae bacterium]